MKKNAILILILIGLAALILEFLEILSGILLVIIGITALLIAFIIWLVKLVS